MPQTERNPQMSCRKFLPVSIEIKALSVRQRVGPIDLYEKVFGNIGPIKWISLGTDHWVWSIAKYDLEIDILFHCKCIQITVGCNPNLIIKHPLAIWKMNFTNFKILYVSTRVIPFNLQLMQVWVSHSGYFNTMGCSMMSTVPADDLALFHVLKHLQVDWYSNVVESNHQHTLRLKCLIYVKSALGRILAWSSKEFAGNDIDPGLCHILLTRPEWDKNRPLKSMRIHPSKLSVPLSGRGKTYMEIHLRFLKNSTQIVNMYVLCGVAPNISLDIYFVLSFMFYSVINLCAYLNGGRM